MLTQISWSDARKRYVTFGLLRSPFGSPLLPWSPSGAVASPVASSQLMSAFACVGTIGFSRAFGRPPSLEKFVVGTVPLTVFRMTRKLASRSIHRHSIVGARQARKIADCAVAIFPPIGASGGGAFACLCDRLCDSPVTGAILHDKHGGRRATTRVAIIDGDIGLSLRLRAGAFLADCSLCYNHCTYG